MNPTGDALNAADAANKPLVETDRWQKLSERASMQQGLDALAQQSRHQALSTQSIDEVCGKPFGHFSNFIREQKTRGQLAEEGRKLEIQVAHDLKMFRDTEPFDTLGHLAALKREYHVLAWQIGVMMFAIGVLVGFWATWTLR